MCRTIIEQLDGCNMAVILGSRTYGKKTDCIFSTHEELLFIRNENKPFFLVKMCSEFAEAHARFHLPKNIAYYQWMPDLDSTIKVPDDLVKQIVAKYAAVAPKAGKAPPPAVKPKPASGDHGLQTTMPGSGGHGLLSTIPGRQPATASHESVSARCSGF